VTLGLKVESVAINSQGYLGKCLKNVKEASGNASTDMPAIHFVRDHYSCNAKGNYLR